MTTLSKVIVLRKHNEMTQPELREHKVNVVDATYQKEAYVAVKTEADLVKLTGDDYETACVAAANGGKSLTETKNEKRLLFLSALDSLGTALQMTVKKELAYITNAFYQYREQPTKSDAPLADPKLEYAVSGVLQGTVEGKLSDFPSNVRTVAVEYSDDNGLTWKNGTYTTGKKFVLAGLTPRTQYLIRVVYHGTLQRTSNPSKAVPVFVL